jgi:hypothetical protein
MPKPLTSYIKHLSGSAYSSVIALIKSACNLTGKCSEKPSVIYTQPLEFIVKSHSKNNLNN